MAHRIVGESFELDSDQIRSIVGHFSSALIGDTLSIDTIEAVIQPDRAFHMGFCPSDADSLTTSDSLIFCSVDTSVDGVKTALADGEYLQWYSDSNLKGKFFVDKLTRQGTNIWKVDASSAIGLLRKRIHDGGIYAGETVEEVLDEIIGDTFTYSIDSDVASQIVSGWLPRASARDNLHQLMLAFGLNITKDTSGDIYFSFITAGTPTAISNDRVFLGGNVTEAVPASRVEVVTHQFVESSNDEEVTLFDNRTTTVASSQLVVFSDAPVHDLVASDGLTIESYNSNYAIVTGMGTLTGQKYTHTTEVLYLENSSANTENVKTLSADTLINDLNGANVLQRLYSYYTSVGTINTDILVETELPNDYVELEDAFGDTRDVWIKSMDVRASTILRASCEMIEGYSPANQGNVYTNYALITADGTWTVPSGVEDIRIILVGGGNGGQGGCSGSDGYGGAEGYGGYLTYVSDDDSKGYVYSGGSQDVPAGGAAGEAGLGGKIYIVDLSVTEGDTIDLVVGTGGAGGAIEGGEGGEGTASTATVDSTTYTSDDGLNSTTYVNPFTGDSYGIEGSAGTAGGDGGQTDIQSLYAYTGNAGYDGSDVDTYTGGTGGAGVDIAEYDVSPMDYVTTYGTTATKTSNGITYTWDSDTETWTVSGTATATSQNNIFNSTSSLPSCFTAGETYQVVSQGLYGTGVRLRRYYYYSDSTYDYGYITIDENGLGEFTIPESAVGIIIRLYVTKNTEISSAVTVSVKIGTTLVTQSLTASGGGGGGAAYGANGSAGTDGTWDTSTGYLTGGTGGDGADATAPSTPTYGCGGGGGNGGGAGGNGAGCRMVDYDDGWYVYVGDGGTGGTGSRGGHGGAGCVLIYY